ncbi:MAG: MBL fold metallo-hydrolase [Bacillota bacterium]|nr:MBL fold metallo-hydrolase [Bacillota bacterium]
MKNKKIIKGIFLLIILVSIFLVSCTAETSKPVLGGNINADKGTASSNEKSSGTLQVHYIDVGQADSILILQGTHAMLIDAGNNDDYELVYKYLNKQGIKNLEYIVGTHPHEDHIGGLDYIIDNFNIGKVILPKNAKSNTKTYTDVLKAVSNKGLKAINPLPGTSFNLGEAVCSILAPNSGSYEDFNNYSVVIKVKFGDNSFLFEGDAEALSEMEMVKKGYNLKADVIKVGHHGSSSSTCAKFLAKVQPKYAVISVGKDNSYGHPQKGTMDRLKNGKIEVYRTDECGTIVALSDGKNITFNVKPGDYKYGSAAN